MEPEPEPVRVNRTTGSVEPELKPEPEPVRVNRPTGSLEPFEKDSLTSRCDFYYKYISLSIIFIYNLSLLLLSLLTLFT